MELIYDWYRKQDLTATSASRSAQAAGPLGRDEIRSRLSDFEPDLISVHCYEDVGYPWAQLVFRSTITPELALRAGDALAEMAGADNVYFNSLRPESVYFILTPAFEPKDLPASRYGSLLRDIRSAWFPGKADQKSVGPDATRPGRKTPARPRSGKKPPISSS